MSAAAVPAAAALPSAAIASALQPDPIFAAIEAHRGAHSKYELAARAADIKGRGPRPARVIVGYFNDGEYARSETDKHPGSLIWKPNGELVPLYAGAGEIERNAPRNLQGAERDVWISERSAALEKEERRIAKAYVRTKRGALEAAAERAYQRERDRMWDLIWMKPTTIAGLCALLEYCRTRESINELVHDDEWEDALEWTIESTVRALAGAPEPPMPDIVAALSAIPMTIQQSEGV